MKLRYSRRATNDLTSIHEYLSARSPRGAVNVMTAIFAAVEFVRRHPDAAEHTRIHGIRGKPFGSIASRFSIAWLPRTT